MKRNLLITGGTGSIGDQFVRGALLNEAFDEVWILTHSKPPALATPGLRFIEADLRRSDLGLTPHTIADIKATVSTFIHAGANTNITHSLSTLRLTNLSGTAHLIYLARHCSLLEQFILVSATQTAGNHQGPMPERQFQKAPSFDNAMMQTLWEREIMCLEEGLPLDILRIAPVLGSMRETPDGTLNPWHLWLGWMFKGLLPLLPAVPETRFDFVPKESVGITVAHILKQGFRGHDAYHLSQGDQAPPITSVLKSVLKTFRRISGEWRDNHRSIPATVDRETFCQFQQNVMDGGHPIYSRVADQALYFLPSLLYPKIFDTQNLRTLYAAEGQEFRVDWEQCLTRTIERLAVQYWKNRSAITTEIAMFLR